MEYTHIDTDNDKIYCYYWEDGKRKFNFLNTDFKYFYADPDINWDDNYKVLKGFTNVDGKIVNKKEETVDRLH